MGFRARTHPYGKLISYNYDAFTGLGGPNDFARQGIISLDGETSQSVTLTSNFKQVKQIEFSLAGQHVIPHSGSIGMLLGVALGTAEVLRRLILKKP